MPQFGSRVVHHRDGRAQRHTRLRLDGVQHMFQYLPDRYAGSYALQHDAFVFQTS